MPPAAAIGAAGNASTAPVKLIGVERESWNTIFNAVTALGTIAVSLLAIFGQRIRSFFIRPRLSLTVGRNPPLADTRHEADGTQSGNIRNSFRIYLKVYNSGLETARNCIAHSDQIWKGRAGGGFYQMKSFVPRPFLWTSGAQKIDVVPKLPTFLSLAEITESPQPSMGTTEIAPASATDCLFVLLETEGVQGRFFCAETGKILMPVVLYADNLSSPMKWFVEVYWTGSACTDVKDANFTIRLITEEQGAKLIGGAA